MPDLHLQKPGTLREAVPDHLIHVTQIAPLLGNGLQIKYHVRIDNCRDSHRSGSLAHRLLVNLELEVRINHWSSENFFYLRIERFLYSWGVSRGTFEGAHLQLIDMSGKVWPQLTNIQPSMNLTVPSIGDIYIINLQLSNGQKASVNVLVGKKWVAGLIGTVIRRSRKHFYNLFPKARLTLGHH